MSELPTVTMEEGAMYWVKPRCGAGEGLWTVARWEFGCFWGVNGQEVSPGVISGPIPRPADAPSGVTATGVSADPGGTETKPEQNLHEKGSEG